MCVFEQSRSDVLVKVNKLHNFREMFPLIVAPLCHSSAKIYGVMLVSSVQVKLTAQGRF